LIPRILFDRSIFHGDGFRRLKQSPLAAWIAARKARLIYTPLFIEETIQYGLKGSPDFNSQWQYLISLNDSFWFKNTNEILALELGNRIVGRKYYLRTKPWIDKVIQDLPALLGGKVPLDQLSEARSQMEGNNLIREKLREQRLIMRKRYPQRPFSFEDVLGQTTEWYIQKGLMQWHSDSEGYLEVWRTNRLKCRFAASHIQAALAIYFLPLADHQLKVDINDKSDAEQLAFMEWGDIFVSDDTRFMKSAFDLLYGQAEKQFMNSKEFIAYLGQSSN